MACAVDVPAPLPPLENWGDLHHPYGDAIEAAAWEALGPRSIAFETRRLEPLRLREFWELDVHTRQLREGLASKLLALHVLNDRDSLPAALEAVRMDPARALAYRESARILVARGFFDRAHALAVQGLRLDGRNAHLFGLLSATYLHRGDNARARVALERALELDARAIPKGYESLAILALRAGDLQAADSLFQLESKPNPTLQLYIQGMQARQRGDLQAARVALSQAARDPLAPAAILIDSGNLEYELGFLQEADSAYTRALRLAPEEPAALNGRATVQRARGDLTGAVASFQRLVAKRPNDSAAQFNLAGTSLDAARRAGQGAPAESLYAVSEKAFSACIVAGFRTSEALDRRAHIRLRRGDAKAAAADARLLLRDPAHARDARLLLARAALAEDRPQEVVRLLAPQFEADSLGLDGLDLLGNTYLKLKRPQEAARVLQRSHARQPTEWQTAMNLGVALSESGDLIAAESILRDLAALRPHDPDVLQNLAAVLQRRGRRSEAARLLEKADRLRMP